jgi:hypothetical protein
MTLFEYFDRTAIIHLPERVDRMSALRKELVLAKFNLLSSKLCVPFAPKPENASGFPSKGVHGNFLSHLEILRAAYSDGLTNVLILEDDAIFSNEFIQAQHTIARFLSSYPWHVVFIGHSIAHGLPKSESRLVAFAGQFIWAHCYGVHRSIMPRMIKYFEETLQRDPGHPEGGKMYIDGAHNEFRNRNPDVICLVTTPCLSVQRGSQSSLGSNRRWYNRKRLLAIPVRVARSARDQLWKHGLISIGPSAKDAIDSTSPWP